MVDRAIIGRTCTAFSEMTRQRTKLSHSKISRDCELILTKEGQESPVEIW